MELKTLNEYPSAAPDQVLSYLFANYNRLPDNHKVVEDTFTMTKGFLEGGLMLTRLRAAGIEAQVDRRVLVTAIAFCENPAIAVLWAHTIFKLWQQHSGEAEGRLTWPVFYGLFQGNFPTEHGYRAAWAAQKMAGGNFLDTPEAWV